MRVSGPPGRQASTAAVAAILYAIVLAGSYLFLRRSLETDPGMPGLYTGAIGAILAILPGASFLGLCLTLWRLARDALRRTWGSRLRVRLSLLFMATAMAALLPPVFAYGSLAVRAAGISSSQTVREAVAGGTELALAWYAGKDAGLRYAAVNDLPALAARLGTDADAALRALEAREPDICALELFADGRSASFAGDPAARSQPGSPPPSSEGFLPRLSAGGSTYSRYALPRPAFAAASGGASPIQGAVLSLRFPRPVEEAASSLAGAARALERTGRIAGSYTLYVVLFGLSLVFPLAALAVVFSQSAAAAVFAPLSALADGIRLVDRGERRVPNLSKPGDESGQLVAEFNAMLERLERSRGDELRNERMGAWRDIARRLAHELRNPLTPIRLSAERVLKRWTSGDRDLDGILGKSMVAIIQETANMEILLSEFRDFARLPEPQKDWVELKELVDEAVHLYSTPWPRLRVDASQVDAGLRIRADRGQIKQVLRNLISNAADATGGEGSITIRSDLVKTEESRYCRLQVADDGRGIPAGSRDRVFSPYFSTKPDGTGLGLAIVDHIIASHGGSVRFDSAEGVGTTFYLDLPAE